MATAVALNDVIQAKFFSATSTQQAINVIGYRVTGLTVAGVTDQDIADSLSASAAAAYKAYFSNLVTYRGVKLQIIRPTLRPAVTSTILAGVGMLAQVPQPTQVCLLLSPRTAVAGRRGRGRCYLPFWNEDHNDANSAPTAGAIASATTWSNAIFAVQNVTVGGSTATISPVIINRGPVPTEILVTSVLIRAQWATQRRRSLINKPDVFGP